MKPITPSQLDRAKWAFLGWFAEHGGKLTVDACGRVGQLEEPLRAAIQAYLPKQLAAERERCAKVADVICEEADEPGDPNPEYGGGWSDASIKIAKRIRALRDPGE